MNIDEFVRWVESHHPDIPIEIKDEDGGAENG